MRRREFLPFGRPRIERDDIEEVVAALRSGWITRGPRARRFEEAFAERIGVPDALALSSATAGLHIALLALGVGPGDEVITTPMGFCASANVIEHVGARPVFADVEPDTLNIDPARIAEAITPRTQAILVVHYAGHPVELDAIHELAGARGLAVVEDSAHAFPARYRGRPIGVHGNLSVFSFHAMKNLTTGDGGMLVGPADRLDVARLLSFHGTRRDASKAHPSAASWYYEVTLPGFKYNITDVQAALGLRQLGKIDLFQARRRQVVQAYRDAFIADTALELPCERPHVESAWHHFNLRLRLEALRIDRDRFIEEMAERRIGTNVHFIPIHLHPYYANKYGYAPHDFPVTYESYQRMLSLPLHPGLSESDVADVVDAVLDVVCRNRR